MAFCASSETRRNQRTMTITYQVFHRGILVMVHRSSPPQLSRFFSRTMTICVVTSFDRNLGHGYRLFFLIHVCIFNLPYDNKSTTTMLSREISDAGTSSMDFAINYKSPETRSLGSDDLKGNPEQKSKSLKCNSPPKPPPPIRMYGKGGSRV